MVLPGGARLQVEVEDGSDEKGSSWKAVVANGASESTECKHRQTDQYLKKRPKKGKADPKGQSVKKKKRKHTPAEKWTLVPESIVKEYWGPKPIARKSSRKPYTQRVMDVRMVDRLTGEKCVLTLKAEDQENPNLTNMIESNPYYTSVLLQWRKEHPEAAAHPLS